MLSGAVGCIRYKLQKDRRQDMQELDYTKIGMRIRQASKSK